MTRKHKIILSTILALVLSAFCFIVFILFLFSFYKTALIIILLVFYLSIMTFLVLWCIFNSKKIKRILFIPLLCVFAVISVIGYQYYVDKIPTVREADPYSKMFPFFSDKNIKALDSESKLKLFNDLPVLDGATALFPVYASFVQAVYSEEVFRELAEIRSPPILNGGTHGAYINLFEGKADIIFCAGPSDEQLKWFTDSGKDIRFIPIGKEAFVFFVNKINPVNNLSIDDIQGIYSGEIKNWKKFNGRFQSIKAFQRSQNSGSQTMLEKIMGDNKIMDARTEKIQGMMEMITVVANYRNFSNSIGYSFLFYATEMAQNDHIKLLSIEGVYPSIETIQNGTYPFSDNFYAIYIESEEKNKNIDAFIEWILSDQGQELIKKTGYVPVK